MSITTAQYLALKPGDKIIPNNVYWHEKRGQVVLVLKAAMIHKGFWGKRAHDHGYLHPSDIPPEVLDESNAWLEEWVYAHPLNDGGVGDGARSLLPTEIDRVFLAGNEKWFEIWDHHDNN